MNKETRSFIWGLIIVIINALAMAIHIIQIRYGVDYGLFEYTIMAFNIIGLIIGFERIYKTIN